ncbi:MAG: hydrogenase maturation protease [Promethearchaeota archaeon]
MKCKIMAFEDFKEHLSSKLEKHEKIAIIGIGADLRMDDAVGTLLVGELIDLINDDDDLKVFIKDYSISEYIYLDGFLIVNATVVPEQYTTRIMSFSPEHLLIIDAAEMGKHARPGDLSFINEKELEKHVSSTHTMPLTIFISLMNTFGVHPEVTLIGIQPKEMDYGDKLSSEVEYTKNFLKDLLLRIIKEKILESEISC